MQEIQDMPEMPEMKAVSMRTVDDDTMDREEILSILHCLMARAESAVVRECLREAYDDIAFLTSTSCELSADEMICSPGSEV